jgi:hypothetical protein
MKAPSRADYVKAYFTLFDQFEQRQTEVVHLGHPFVYADRILVVFFTMMLIRRITAFKAQRRWLETHPDETKQLGFPRLPHRTTLSRRYKDAYETVQHFVAFIGHWAEQVHESLNSHVLVEDSSLFKAQGPVWHQSDRRQGRIPEGLRHLDTDASWRKSGYHGWVYGYGLHLTCNLAGFPKLVQVETGSAAEATVLDAKTEGILGFHPDVLVGDNGYFKATRVRNWAKQGVLLLTPATRWKQGGYAQGYHRFLKEPEPAQWLRARGTAIEPVFDLFCKVLDTQDNQKQLPIQGLANVRTFLSLGVLAVQVAMIVNNVWGRPLRQIYQMLSVFS